MPNRERPLPIRLGEKTEPSEPLRDLGRIGGIPWLPSDFEVPCSVLTSAPMAFLFQILFPSDHPLHRYTVAMFMALDGVDEDLVVPPLSCGELSRGPVTSEQLFHQQALHGACLFGRNDLRPCPDLLSPIEGRRLVADEHSDDASIFGWMGLHPEWLQADETPNALSDRTISVFAFSIAENLVLPRRAGAPLQIELDFFAPDERRMRTDGYELFAGNAVYFLAYPDADTHVAVVVQGR